MEADTTNDSTEKTNDDIEIAIVAAVAANRVIGRDGDLPWYYPEDLRHFKETTIGHPVVMGRRTFEGIVDRLGEPLPERTNIVLTRGGLKSRIATDDVLLVSSVESALDASRKSGTEYAFVIGGATIYDQFLAYADRLVLTEIHDPYEGDVYFPSVDWTAWREVQRDSHENFDFVEYIRRG